LNEQFSGSLALILLLLAMRLNFKRRSLYCIPIIGWPKPDWAKRVCCDFRNGGKANLGEDGGIVLQQPFCRVVPAFGCFEHHEDPEWKILEVGTSRAIADGKPARLVIVQIATSAGNQGVSCTPKTGPEVKLDFSRSAKNEKEQIDERKTKTS
jgi:hypothetical protein